MSSVLLNDVVDSCYRAFCHDKNTIGTVHHCANTHLFGIFQCLIEETPLT